MFLMSSMWTECGCGCGWLDNLERAKVTFDYEAEDETNITIAVGDVVVVVDKSDADWWEGYIAVSYTHLTLPTKA